MIGICRSAVCLGLYRLARHMDAKHVSQTHSGLLDQGIQGANSAPVASRHSIHFVHDQTCLVVHAHVCHSCRLSNQPAIACVEAKIPASQAANRRTWMPLPEKKPSRLVLSMLVPFCPNQLNA
jgi:hypothetical protein